MFFKESVYFCADIVLEIYKFTLNSSLEKIHVKFITKN